jgi:hypothetical protein
LKPTVSRVRILLAAGVVVLVLLVFFRARDGARASEEKTRAAVLGVLNGQVEAWNEGDLDGFLSGYWRSDELTFFSGDAVRHGWQETHDRYLWKYKSARKELAVALLVGQSAAGSPGVPLGAAAQQLAVAGLMESGAHTAEMGKLLFENLRVTSTGPKSAVVRGHWELTFKDGRKVGGLFTLLFREEAQGWCVIHDHTS